jgi:hypothetical protein
MFRNEWGVTQRAIVGHDNVRQEWGGPQNDRYDGRGEPHRWAKEGDLFAR